MIKKTKKNVIALLSSLFILISIMISCNNDLESKENSSKTINEQMFLREVTNPNVLEFETDVKNSNLEKEMKDWKTAADEKDFAKLVEQKDLINGIFNTLYSKYGEEKVKEYVQILINEENKALGTHDGSACTRNLDGTIYTGACSFWENVQFFFSLACSGMPTGNSSQINAYYNCLQADICKICG